MTSCAKKCLISVFLGLFVLVAVPNEANCGEHWYPDWVDQAVDAVVDGVEFIAEGIEEIVDAIGDFEQYIKEKGEELAKKLINKMISAVFDIKEVVCPAYQTFVNSYKVCHMCKIYNLIFSNANAVCGAITAAVSPSAADALLAFFALWMAITVLKDFANVGGGVDGLALLTKILGMLLRVTICYLILLDSCDLVFEYVVNPVLTEMVAYVTAVTDSPCSVGAGGASSTAPLSPSVKTGMACMIKNISDELAETLGLSAAFRCGARMWKPIDWLPFQVTHPVMWMYGCIIGAFFWVASLMFPLCLLDVIFRIGILLGFTPLFFLAAVFDSTRAYAIKGFQEVVAACAVFVVASLIVGIIADVAQATFTIFGDAPGGGEFYSMMKGNQYLEAYKSMSDGGTLTSLLALICVGVWAIYMAPRCDKITQGFWGGHDIPSSAFRAMMALINLCFSIIILILTILTDGLTFILYLARFVKLVSDLKKANERVQKIVKIVKRVGKAAKKTLETAKKAAEAAQKAAQASQKSIGT